MTPSEPIAGTNGRSGALSAAAPFASLSVMTVDDQESMRSMLRLMLQALGIDSICEAGDGKEALDLLQRPNAQQVDFIICDLNMRAMDGLTFCDSVRRSILLHGRHLPILVLTADHDELLLDIVRRVGAADIARKPISAADLRRHIEQLVNAAAR